VIFKEKLQDIPNERKKEKRKKKRKEMLIIMYGILEFDYLFFHSSHL